VNSDILAFFLSSFFPFPGVLGGGGCDGGSMGPHLDQGLHVYLLNEKEDKYIHHLGAEQSSHQAQPATMIH